MGYARLAALLLALPLAAEPVRLSGLRARVEVLRDQWGIPHIYAQNQDDLYFAQGYMAARDRLWQIDLWRRAGSGKLSAALGPAYLERDRTALLLRFRGDWKAEWTSYAPDTYQIARAFTNGINAYIQQGGRRTREFQQLGYEPGLWQPEDVLSRVAVFSMMANVLHEVTRARQLDAFGPAALERVRPTDPPIPQRPAPELNLKDITRGAIADFDDATDPVSLEAQGSNNWVVSGKRSTTGKPLLASDPHRALQIPSLRRTIHLVAPGINQIGAGEPALPGIALGHNESIGFGFTITGTDQQDLYVEQLSPSNLDDYLHAGVWKRMTVERHTVAVKGGRTEIVECRYTVHGPVIGLDPTRRRAYAMRWVGAEPGTAGYLGALSLARAQTWPQFLAAAARFKAPAENLLYADTAGNIGFAVAGLTPIRKNWNGLFPVPGHTGTYEWAGFLDPAQLPRTLNPREGFLATANDNILPPGYPHILSYEWAPPFRAHRIRAQLAARRQWSLEDFARLQTDIVSPPAKRFQAILKRWNPRPQTRAREILPALLAWDGRMTVDSMPAAVIAVWMSKLGAEVFRPANLGARARLDTVLQALEANPNPAALEKTLAATLAELSQKLGPQPQNWRWGAIHLLYLAHPSRLKPFDRGPLPLPGDANTINAAGGANLRATHGASFRMLLDTANWDRSRMTNAPGESGDPDSPHYSDLLTDWANGVYHPLLFTRAAVEANLSERIALAPR